MTKIKTICCVCKDTIQEGPLSKEGLMSHGYCERCAAVIMEFIKETKNDRTKPKD